MELDYILKLCLTIILVVFTLIIIISFIEAIVKKIRKPKIEREKIKVLDKATDEFIKYLKEELDNGKKAKTIKNSKKSTKNKED